jgi:hypothetical protein
MSNLKTIKLLVIGLFFVQLAGAETPKPPNSGRNEPQSSIPIGNCFKALQEGGFAEADRWFTITARDFPEEPDGLRALAMQLLNCGANELSQVRVARYLHDRAQLELKNKQNWLDRSEFYEKQAVNWGEKMVGKGELFLARDQQRPLKFVFGLDLKGLDIEKLRSRLARGESLDDREMQRLIHGEWLRNYVGYLREILDSGKRKIDFSGHYAGLVNRASFYRAFGVRFFIVGTKAKNQRAIVLSRRFFDRVIKLTQKKPYDHDRQQALDFLARLDDIPGSKQMEKNNEVTPKAKQK